MITTNISLPTVVTRVEWQRTLERRRLHEIGLTLGRDDHDKPRMPAPSAVGLPRPMARTPAFSPAFDAHLIFEKIRPGPKDPC